MTRIIRAPGGLDCHPPFDYELVLDMSEPDGAPLPWAGARRAIGTLRETFGDTAVEEALQPHRAPLSLVLTELAAGLTAAEARIRASLAASSPTALFYPMLNPWPLAEAFASVLAHLIRHSKTAVIARNVRAIDVESLRLIRPLLRRTMARGNVDFLLGVDTRFVPANQVAQLADEIGALEMRRLEALPGTIVLERTAACDTSQTASTGSAVEPSLDGVREAFDAYGFAYAFHLAERFLDRHPPLEKAADAHAIAAVSAYQLRAAGGGVREMVEAARRHRLAALDSPDGDVRYPHLICRQVIQEAGARNFARANELAASVLTLSRSGRLAEGFARYTEIWGLNARAFIEFRAGDTGRAAGTVKQALELTNHAAGWPDVPELHVQMTRYYLCRNMTQVAETTGDKGQAIVWQERTDRRLQEIPEARRPAFGGLSAAAAVADLEAAVEDLEASLGRARAGLSPEGETRFCLALGGVEYRRGYAVAAYLHFERAREIQKCLRAPDEELLPTILNAGLAALRAGRHQDALVRFGELMADPEKLAIESQAEILSVRALCASRLGDLDLAHSLACEALTLRSRADIPVDARARIARWAGEALADATLLETGLREAQQNDRVSLTDRLGLLVALSETGADGELIRCALRLIPAALEEDDANLWWEFPRILARLPEIARCAGADSELALAVEALLAAAAERPDCAQLLAQCRQPA